MDDNDVWRGDLFSRKHTGKFLYNTLINKVNSTSTGTVCCALDGDWGTGKSYFLEKWAQELKNLQHPVVTFDAWINDLSDEPLLGFLAALKEQISVYQDGIPLASKAAPAIRSAVSNLLKNAAKAILPATGAALKNAAIRYAGQEAIDLLSGAPTYAKDGPDNNKILTEEDLEKILTAALEKHTGQQKALQDTRISLAQLVDELDKLDRLNKPIFILIDELDRCRPDYAIRLLEGVKHLFSAPQVCFVIAINARQLSASIRSVYGESFDGDNYLRRFFDFQYTIPEADRVIHAKHICREISGKTLVSLVCEESLGKDHLGQSDTFAIICKTFDLSLRDQSQIVLRVEAAIACISDQEIDYFTLCLFSAISLKCSDALTGAISSDLGFWHEKKSTFKREASVSFFTSDSVGAPKRERLSIVNLADECLGWIRTPKASLVNKYKSINNNAGPLDQCLRLCAKPSNSHPKMSRAYDYAALVHLAGGLDMR